MNSQFDISLISQDFKLMVLNKLLHSVLFLPFVIDDAVRIIKVQKMIIF